MESFLYKGLEINNVQWWAQYMGNYSAGIYSWEATHVQVSDSALKSETSALKIAFV